MKLIPTFKNKSKLKQIKPIVDCHLQTGKSSTGWLPDTITVKPNYQEQKTHKEILPLQAEWTRIEKQKFELPF